MSLLDLPREVKLDVLRFLRRRDLVPCQLTCRHLLEFIDAYMPPGWGILRLSPQLRLRNFTYTLLIRFGIITCALTAMHAFRLLLFVLSSYVSVTLADSSYHLAWACSGMFGFLLGQWVIRQDNTGNKFIWTSWKDFVSVLCSVTVTSFLLTGTAAFFMTANTVLRLGLDGLRCRAGFYLACSRMANRERTRIDGDLVAGKAFRLSGDDLLCDQSVLRTIRRLLVDVSMSTAVAFAWGYLPTKFALRASIDDERQSFLWLTFPIIQGFNMPREIDQAQTGGQPASNSFRSAANNAVRMVAGIFMASYADGAVQFLASELNLCFESTLTFAVSVSYTVGLLGQFYIPNIFTSHGL